MDKVIFDKMRDEQVRPARRVRLFSRGKRCRIVCRSPHCSCDLEQSREGGALTPVEQGAAPRRPSHASSPMVCADGEENKAEKIESGAGADA